MTKLLRITTIPLSLKVLLKGQHRFMKANGLEVIGVSSKGKELQEVQADEGIEVIPLEMTRTISPLKDLKSLWQFYRLCKQEKPQIVHSHTPKAGIIGMLGAKLAGVPFRLHTVAGMPLMEAKGLKRMVLDLVEKLTYACATKVYPNSKGLYDFIVQQRYTSIDKLKVIANGSSNGIDTAYFSKSEELEKEAVQLRHGYGIKEDDFVFVFVGRLVGDKGVNELVSAFAKLQQSTASQVHKFTGSQVHRFTGLQAHKFTSSLKLLLVGPLESDLDPLSPETLQEIEKNPDIIAAGFQKDVRPFFAMSDALVFPSYREGFPNVVMQAGAMGLPAIVSDINGCNEIIEEGVNGLIIPVKDSEALYMAMERLLLEPGLYDKLKVQARVMIGSRYEQKVVWDALLSEYRSLLREKDFLA